jgi:TPP-dependent pyruvate/acetoin dehydrogenase alpha subunit
VAAGACAALQRDDYITSTHQGHGHCIAKGGRLDLMMAELFGKATGYCSGKGGSMHIVDLDIGILGSNGIVGGGIPIAVGTALACKTLEKGRAGLCFFSDGASNQDSFHEAANLAALLILPAIFLCENNQWAVSTRVLDMHTIKPLDEAAVLAAAEETRAIITAEEHSRIGGLDGAVAEVLAEAGAAVRFKRLGLPDIFATEGNADYLRHRYGLDGEGIAREAVALLEPG